MVRLNYANMVAKIAQAEYVPPAMMDSYLILMSQIVRDVDRIVKAAVLAIEISVINAVLVPISTLTSIVLHAILSASTARELLITAFNVLPINF